MPPKARITKKMILHTVLKITRESGFDSVNARRIAEELGCSTRPVFTCYENMEELKRKFLGYAFSYYEQYTTENEKNAETDPCLLHPLSYVSFAGEEANLFKILFINDMDLNMKKPDDFYMESGNEKKAAIFAEKVGVDQENAKKIFLDLFFYSHGIAVLTATGKLSLDRKSTEKMLSTFLEARIGQKEA